MHTYMYMYVQSKNIIKLYERQHSNGRWIIILGLLNINKREHGCCIVVVCAGVGGRFRSHWWDNTGIFATELLTTSKFIEHLLESQHIVCSADCDYDSLLGDVRSHQTHGAVMSGLFGQNSDLRVNARRRGGLFMGKNLMTYGSLLVGVCERCRICASPRRWVSLSC